MIMRQNGKEKKIPPYFPKSKTDHIISRTYASSIVSIYSTLHVYVDARSRTRSFSQSNDCGLKYVTTRSWFFANAHPT